jgi:hypothetical protein
MRMLADIESNFATEVHPDFEIAGMADSFHSAEFSVSNLQLPRRGRELNAVARGCWRSIWTRSVVGALCEPKSTFHDRALQCAGL